MSSTKNDLEISYEQETKATETMDAFRKHQQMLDERGFRGDADVPFLGLDEMEDELTMEAAERLHRLAPNVNSDRRRLVATPWSLDRPGHREARIGEHMGDQHGEGGHASFGWGWDNVESDE